MLNNVSIAISGLEHAAKFLLQSTHTISENGVTQLAYVGPCSRRDCGEAQCVCGSESSTCCSESESLSDLSELQHVTRQALRTGELDVAAFLIDSHFAPEMPNPCSISMQQQHDPLQPQDPVNYLCSPLPSAVSSPDWRCIHQNIVITPLAPEILVASDGSCRICIQWPTIVHATAYVVELLNQTTGTLQRFIQGTPEGVLPALMDLELEGLQPGAYAACVRSKAPCGCESVCSPWSFLTLGLAPPTEVAPLQPVVHVMPSNPSPAAPVAINMPPACPPPPSAPPCLPLTAVAQPSALPPIPEETIDTIAKDEILTLD